MFDMKLLADKVIFDQSDIIDLRQYYKKVAANQHSVPISESVLIDALSAHLNENLRGIEFSVRQNLVKRLISDYLLNEQVHQLSYYDVAGLLLSLDLPTKQLIKNLQGWILMSTEYALPEQDIITSLTHSKLIFEPEALQKPEVLENQIESMAVPAEVSEDYIEEAFETLEASAEEICFDEHETHPEPEAIRRSDDSHFNIIDFFKQYKEQFRYGFIFGTLALLLCLAVIRIEKQNAITFNFRDVCYMLQRVDHKPRALNASVKLVYETSKDGVPAYLRYNAIDENRLRGYLKRNNSMLANDPYYAAIMDAAAKMDVNPLLLFAITGQEQNFVRRGSENAALIVNNPFNVYHSWVDYNTNIKDAAQIAANTVYLQLDKRPASSDPFQWLNRTYAEDPKWHLGVEQIFLTLDSYCNPE